MMAAMMTASNFRPLSKGHLRGFLDLTLDSGLIIKGCQLYEKDGHRWVGMPTEKYVDDAGKTRFAERICFASNRVRAKFRHAALAATDKLLLSQIIAPLKCQKATNCRESEEELGEFADRLARDRDNEEPPF